MFVLWLALPADRAAKREPAPGNDAPLALFTSLPLYWTESEDIGELLDDSSQLHWARRALERQEVLHPLDYLATGNLEQYGALLVAQPRALSPEENVALDNWVRSGGRLLLFTDPLLTAESRFGLGDPRRPADVGLLSPILARWGLELTFDPDQPEGVRTAEVLGEQMPVEMAGKLVDFPVPPGATSECRLLADGLAADCTIGAGGALVIADAALLDRDAPDQEQRGEILLHLLNHSYGIE
ncbi:MAG TPA: ABC transporter [Sphingomonadaceae bacterium]|nr:ABC transporter [Sphingomonadaceae bacterium]